MITFNYEKLEVVKLAYKLLDKIYLIVKKFPPEEKFVLTSQVRRAGISIVLNIAEGSGRHSKKDFARYIRNAIGSLLEVDACFKIAINRKYITLKDYNSGVHPLIEELFYKLIGFEKSLIGKRHK